MVYGLNKIIEAVSATGSLDEAMNRLVQEIKAYVKVDVASIFICDVAKQRYLLLASDGLNQDAVGYSQLFINEGLVGLVAQREEPINLSHAKSHPNFCALHETGEHKFSSFLGVPIVYQGQVLAVLVVQRIVQEKFIAAEESLLLTLCALLSEVLIGFEARDAVFGYNFTTLDPKGVRFQGNGASPGIAIGTTLVLVSQKDFSTIPIRQNENVTHEIKRFQQACEKVQQDLLQLKEKMLARLGDQEVALFAVYDNILADPAFVGEIEKLIGAGLWAPSAVKQVVLNAMDLFDAIDDDYIKERSVDVKDVGYRLLNKLESTHIEIPGPDQGPFILIGDELSATLLMEIPKASIAGVISLKGTINAHMAIVARAIELPAVVGIENLKLDVLDGKTCIVDGNTGQFFISPSSHQLEHYSSLIEGQKELNEYLVADIFRPTQTKCGQSFELLANVGVASDAKLALKRSAQGIGLFRSEIAFMALDQFPSESEQETLYRAYLEPFQPLPVTIRTLDIGGDKSLPYFPIYEANPVLGWRGLRFTLDHPEILMIQIRAMLKASEGLNNLRILLPMVTEVRELDRAIVLIKRAYNEVIEEGHKVEWPSIGAMIEVPAAISQISAFARRIDFLSVGTNDLIQYMLAVDRNNPRVAHLFQSFHPAILHTLEDIFLKSEKANCELCICGEVAGDPAMSVLLMGIGYRQFSLGPNCLLKVKWTLSQMKLSQMQALWNKVSGLESVELIRETVMTQLSHYGVVSGFSSPEAPRDHQRGAAAG